jgi:hypothetical protein
LGGHLRDNQPLNDPGNGRAGIVLPATRARILSRDQWRTNSRSISTARKNAGPPFASQA